MGVLESLFGRKRPPKPKTDAKPSAATDPRQDPNLIRVFDAYGRELFISKGDWRTSVLPGAIKENWDNADRLYDTIVGALNDGFRKDVVAAAKRLYEIDKQLVRAACLWGIVLMEEGRHAEAEQVLRGYCDRHGDDGYVLTNLAKVLAKRGDGARSETTLWRALQVDPNQENGLDWYVAIQRERAGEPAQIAALRKLAALPSSWRAQIWLARAALERQDLDEAQRLYRECLARSQRPIAADILMQISGDLGKAGRLQELLSIVEPEFTCETHGLLVGNNLIKAHLDLGHVEEAQRVLNLLYAQKRPDFQETLSFWDTEIAKTKVARQPATPQAELKVAGLVLEGPVWLKPDSPAAPLFATGSTAGTVVSFLGSSAEVANKAERPERQLADAPGRASRAVPLFLAEQVALGTDALARTVVPWIQGSGGFVLFGTRLSDGSALAYARHVEGCAYLAASHLDASREPWTIAVRLLRMSDGECVGELVERFPSATPTDSIQRIARQLRDLACRTGKIHARALPSAYSLPAADRFPSYLVRLEQLLAVRCSSMEGAQRGFLSGEREILAGNLDQCLNAPASVSVRLLLAQTLLAMKRVRPDVVAEFRERISKLQHEHRLPEPTGLVVQGVIDSAFAE